MRGIFSILLSAHPDLHLQKTGVIVLSCSSGFDEKIARKAMEWLPHIQWTMVKRFEPSFGWFEGKTIFSSYASTLTKQRSLITTLRRGKYDVLVLAATNEDSYRFLKYMGLAANARSMVVFNENIDAYVACREHLPIIVQHLRWRFAQRRIVKSGNIFIDAVSRVFLFPPAFLYLTLRTMYLVLRRRLRRLS